jgi:hypothetical protein
MRGLGSGNLSSRGHETDNNMTGGGETRNKVDIYYRLLVKN